MLGRRSVPKTMLRETEPKTTFSHRKPEVGRIVQFHERPPLLGEVYVHTAW